MEIKPVSGGISNLVKNNVVKKQEEQQKQDTSSRDRLEISEEAKSISYASIKDKNVEEIRKKVDSGFYNSDEVINKVADKILKELSE
jgi:negative regulator of flagellin synthesis FlgM